MSRSAYHKWASGKLGRRAAENERLADRLERIHRSGRIETGQQRMTVDRNNFLFFLCPLDGKQFMPGWISRVRYWPVRRVADRICFVFVGQTRRFLPHFLKHIHRSLPHLRTKICAQCKSFGIVLTKRAQVFIISINPKATTDSEGRSKDALRSHF